MARADAERNRATILTSAVTTLHRDGLNVPMATIAEDAGVGVGTLYRHFPTRAALLAFLTHQSFLQVLENAESAERDAADAQDALRRFINAAIEARNALMLPLHGGPPPADSETIAVRAEVHATIQRILDRGAADGSIVAAATPREIVIFGAMLAQPRPQDPTWDETCRQLLEVFLAGLGVQRN